MCFHFSVNFCTLTSHVLQYHLLKTFSLHLSVFVTLAMCPSPYLVYSRFTVVWNRIMSILQLHYSFSQLFFVVNLKTSSCGFIGRALGSLDGDCAESHRFGLSLVMSLCVLLSDLPPCLGSALGVFSIQMLYMVCKICTASWTLVLAYRVL